LCELEEAWVIESLVRKCGLAQKDVAALLKRHLSWVSRRLTLAERLDASVQQDMRLGLIHPTAARELVHLPRGKHAQVAEAIRQNRLSSRQVAALVQVLQACDDDQIQAVLSKPLRYLEPSRNPTKRQPTSLAAARGSLGYWLLRLSEAVQRVDLLVGSVQPEPIDIESMNVLSKQAPPLIARLEGLRRNLCEVLGTESFPKVNDAP
jgi:ParB-like chromosome segregation protein Spo0J